MRKWIYEQIKNNKELTGKKLVIEQIISSVILLLLGIIGLICGGNTITSILSLIYSIALFIILLTELIKKKKEKHRKK